MVVEALLDLAEYGYLPVDSNRTKVLDFGVSDGGVGELLHNLGYSEIYGQTGSEQKQRRVLMKGHYKQIDAFIVGKQSMPNYFRRNFDIVSCAANLGVGLMPSKCLADITTALKKGGILSLSINERMLKPDTDKKTGYRETIEKLTETGVWKPLTNLEFVRESVLYKSNEEQRYRVMTFEKL